MAWRLLRNRLPTKDNLVRRHIIPPDASLCVTGCGGVETAQHLFLSYPVFAPLWGLIRFWIDISSADPFYPVPNHARSPSASGSQVRFEYFSFSPLSILPLFSERRKKAGVMSLSLLIYSFLFPVKKFEKLFSNSATNHQSMQVLFNLISYLTFFLIVSKFSFISSLFSALSSSHSQRKVHKPSNEHTTATKAFPISPNEIITMVLGKFI
ncbi:hypothetical protein QL285_073347 [Trifolium repens]|nr:hypothetical protein QL285_073347 [Trifolium repens]